VKGSLLYLNSFLLKFDLDSQLFTQYHIRVVSPLKRTFQLVQLILSKDCPMSSLALLQLLLIGV